MPHSPNRIGRQSRWHSTVKQAFVKQVFAKPDRTTKQVAFNCKTGIRKTGIRQTGSDNKTDGTQLLLGVICFTVF